MNSFQFYFGNPTSIVIAGPSASEKNLVSFDFPQRISYSAFGNTILLVLQGIATDFWKDFQFLQILLQTGFAHGIDNEILEKIQAADNNLVLLDDLMSSARDPNQISKFFTQEAHEKKYSDFSCLKFVLSGRGYQYH